MLRWYGVRVGSRLHCFSLAIPARMPRVTGPIPLSLADVMVRANLEPLRSALVKFHQTLGAAVVVSVHVIRYGFALTEQTA